MGKNKKISSGVKVGLIAITINIITVAVYIYQTNLMQKQQHASVWPYLEWRIIYNQDDGVVLKVRNNGVGPAIINKAAIKLNNNPVPVLDSLFSKLLGTTQFPHLTAEVQNRVLPAGESINMIKVVDPKWAELLYAKVNESNFEMKICYESIYEDQWVCTGTIVKESRCN
ncbi:hypothetical protein [Aquimarina sp. Aq78]|uniref:hypothetical protein n=1 Tax=Aquimarina sp. Aq78 TaxID=1191889 RepID=UPI000D0E767F|nr:hypothetical protein [Aquimarina sp. Aq78]